MDQKKILGVLMAILFGSILFSPPDSGIWKFFFFWGLIFGTIWFFKK
jgi:hypothetical protein